MNTRTKNQEEWLVMRSFRDNYPEFPKGKLTKSESPDFTLKLSITNSIGIETAKIYKRQAAALNETTMRSIIYRAHELYRERYKNPVLAQVFFDPSFTKPINDELYATKIAIAIINVVADHKYGAQYMEHINADQLPPGISRIIIHAHPTFKSSFWDLRSELSVQDVMNNDFIEELVNKKEEKLRLYQKQIHDYYWLILSIDYIDKPSSFNFETALEQLKIESSFNKVFLFDLFEQKYHVLV